MCLDVPLGALARVDALADRGVLGRQAERVEPLRVEHVHAVARAEARDDVADRVDEHVPHVQRPRRVREHLEDVALRSASRARSRRRTPSRPPRPAATSPRSLFASYLSIASLIRFGGTKKPLAREAPTRTPRLSPRSFPGLWKKLLHEPKTVPGRIRRCSSSFPDSARIETGRARARRRAGVRSSRSGSGRRSSSTARRRSARQARALRAAAGADGRVFYGTKAFPNVAVLRLLREEGVGADVASAGELAFARAAGLAGERARRARQQQGRGVPARGRGASAPRSCSTRRTRPSSRRPPASSACSCASRSASTRTRTRRS